MADNKVMDAGFGAALLGLGEAAQVEANTEARSAAADELAALQAAEVEALEAEQANMRREMEASAPNFLQQLDDGHAVQKEALLAKHKDALQELTAAPPTINPIARAVADAADIEGGGQDASKNGKEGFANVPAPGVLE